MDENTQRRPMLDGTQRSLWLETTPVTAYDVLDDGERLSVDTVVVGGGIAGITTATKLSEAGQSVALVERDRIVSGVTGRTTAKITSLHGLKYDYLADRFGLDTARLYAEANEAAIDDIESTVDEYGIDCAFERMPAYTYVDSEAEVDDVRAEAQTARHLGLPASLVDVSSIPFESEAGVRFDDQAVFHPRAYLLELAARFASEPENYLFERTTVTDVDEGTPCTVSTDRGLLRADDVVLATHFPVVDKGVYFARMEPKRSYVLAVRVAADPPAGMYYRHGDPLFSVRPVPDSERLVLVGGQGHRTGHGGGTTQRYRRLERQARSAFDVESVEYRWSTQDFTSVDGIPFIGAQSPLTDHLYVATGFGGWGMTGGTVAGMLLADLVRGRDNEWQQLYRPSRLSVRASADTFVSHNRHAMEHFVENYVTDRPAPGPVDLAPGEGTVVETDDGPVGVSRDESGTYRAVSAVCPHMGCLVEWNDGEQSWDCPCHGSRFDADGEVLDTPAVDGLSQRDYPRRDDASRR